MSSLSFIYWGEIPYQDAWQRQHEIFDQKIRLKLFNETAEQTDYFILCTHPPVYTIGRNGNRENLLVSEEELRHLGAEFYKIDRGGDITFHGPGQVVGYPIIDLEHYHWGIKTYIYNIEELIIRLLAMYGIRGERLEGATGVWIEPQTARARKICAIGVRASHYVTMHGFALNVSTDLNWFQRINPCGFTDKGVTTMERELGRKVETEEIILRLKSLAVEMFTL